MTGLMLVVVSVLLISAICSLFEAVLYSVPKSHVEILQQRGQPAGRTLGMLLQKVDRPIAAILSLNTVANTGGSAVAGALAVSVFGASKIGYFSVAFTLAILLFAEVLPKTIGVVYARPLSTWIARPLQGLVILFQPLIALTQLITNLVCPGNQEHHVSDEEVITLVSSGLRSGDFKPQEAEIITNVLALEGKMAKDVLTPRTVVFSLNTTMSAKEASEKKALVKHTRVPVFDKHPDDVVGIVHRIDVLMAVANDRFDVKVEELMRPVDFIVETFPLDRLLRKFLENRPHLLAIVDEFGGFAGIVTLEDVLEELIGHEIVDESDQVTDLRAFAHQQRDKLLKRSKDENV
jgi:CBS domain containing-hemolysin-like protein